MKLPEYFKSNKVALQQALQIAALSTAYYLSGQWGLNLHSVSGFATPIWAPTGLSLAALFLWGNHLWPGVLLGAFGVNLSQGASIPLALMMAAGNTLEAVVACRLLRFAGFQNVLTRLRDIFTLLFLAALGSTTISATVGIGALLLTQSMPLSAAFFTWKIWWTGDMLSNLIVAPVLFVWWKNRSIKFSLQSCAEALVLGTCLVLVTGIIFNHPFDPPSGRLPLPYLIFPPLIWASLRFGPVGAASATFVTAFLSIAPTLRGQGPFGLQAFTDNLFALQLYMGVMAVTALVFAALATERAESREALRKSHEELEKRVTERTKELLTANTLLKERREQLNEAQRIAHLGSWEWDRVKNQMSWSDELYRIYGWPPQGFRIRYTAVLRYIHPADRRLVKETLRKALRTKKPFSADFRLLREDREERFLRTYGAVIVNSSDQPIRVIGTAQDITEQRQAERTLQQKEEELFQARKLEAIGRLAGGVAHDFNNLITGILGISQDLKTTFSQEDPRREEIEEVIKASNRAFDVTRQLLAFGRRQIVSPKIIDINTTIQDFAKLLHRLIGEDIRLEVKLCDRSYVKMDPGNLEQILLNLTLNARDAMPKGGTISLRTSPVLFNKETARATNHILLEVSDTGKGMNEEVLSHIFEPFYTTKTKEKGTGLGLATVYGIVQQSNGEILVDSQVNVGTSFKIYLPLETDFALEETRPAKTLPPAKDHETVLVIEDEDIVRRVVVKRLSQAGYHVLEATEGAKALELLKDQNALIDLVVTDVVMPGMNGREVAERIRTRYPKVRILYMSGYPEEIIARRGTLVPGINFIEKAAIQHDLLKKVREVLSQSISQEKEQTAS